MQKNPGFVKSIQKTHFKIALFCDHFLKELREENDNANSSMSESSTNQTQLVETIISNIFVSMKFGSPTARDRVPRLLELMEQFPKLHSFFAAKAKEGENMTFLTL